MESALTKLSEIKLLVSKHISEDCIIGGPKTCLKLQRWFSAANTKELPAQPTTGNNIPPTNNGSTEIPPVEKVRLDVLNHFAKVPEESSLPGVVTFVYNYMRRYIS